MIIRYHLQSPVKPTPTLKSIAHLHAVPGGFCCLRLPQEVLEAHQLFAEPWWLGNQALLCLLLLCEITWKGKGLALLIPKSGHRKQYDWYCMVLHFSIYTVIGIGVCLGVYQFWIRLPVCTSIPQGFLGRMGR